jgi:hypothetical protein
MCRGFREKFRGIVIIQIVLIVLVYLLFQSRRTAGVEMIAPMGGGQ